MTTDAQAINLGGSIGLGGMRDDGAVLPYIFATIHGKKANSVTSDTSGYFAISTRDDTDGTTEKLRITNKGNVGIGTTSPDHDLEIGTGTYSEIDAGEASFTTGSSRTYKENIRPVAADGILGKISNVPVNTFDFKKELCPEGGDKCTDKMGLIAEDFHTVFGRGSDKEISGQEVTMALWLAVQELTEENGKLKEKNGKMEADIESLRQEVQEVFPDTVDDSDPDELSLAQGEFMPYVVKAIQEQQSEIEELKSENQMLKQRMAMLEAKVT